MESEVGETPLSVRDINNFNTSAKKQITLKYNRLPCFTRADGIHFTCSSPLPYYINTEKVTLLTVLFEY